MFLHLTLALCCFVFAMQEYFVGYVEGASLQPDWIEDLVLGEPVAGLPLLVAFGFFLIYHVGMTWRGSSRR